MSTRQIRAVYDAHSIRVYQAYSHTVADAALAHGSFAEPSFNMQRMSWIKPSFLWMMYRAGWGYKDAGQSRILAIDISREGFDWALAQALPSHTPAHPDADARLAAREALRAAPVIIQWDPERDLWSRPDPAQRSIQVGLRGPALALYVQQWIQRISDITPLAHQVHALLAQGLEAQARAALPLERCYPGLP